MDKPCRLPNWEPSPHNALTAHKIMPATTSYTKLITVLIELHREERMFSITSKDVPGLFLAGCDLPALLGDIPAAIKLLFSLNYDMEVQVLLTTEGSNVTSQDGEWLPMSSKYIALPLQA